MSLREDEEIDIELLLVIYIYIYIFVCFISDMKLFNCNT